MEEEISAWDYSEDTPEEIILKISAMATRIRMDWNDPRSECREIWRLCTKLSDILNIIEENDKRN